MCMRCPTGDEDEIQFKQWVVTYGITQTTASEQTEAFVCDFLCKAYGLNTPLRCNIVGKI